MTGKNLDNWRKKLNKNVLHRMFLDYTATNGKLIFSTSNQVKHTRHVVFDEVFDEVFHHRMTHPPYAQKIFDNEDVRGN